jgi:YD repeat-containing protein
LPQGLPIGEYRLHGANLRLTWHERADQGGDACVRRLTIDDRGRAPGTAAFCAARRQDGAVSITYRRASGQSHEEALLRHEPQKQELLIRRPGADFINEIAVFRADGLPDRRFRLPCDSATGTCDLEWEETAYTYDEKGNPVGYVLDDNNGHRATDVVNYLNDRGDWEVWHPAEPFHPNAVQRRRIFYRE